MLSKLFRVYLSRVNFIPSVDMNQLVIFSRNDQKRLQSNKRKKNPTENKGSQFRKLITKTIVNGDLKEAVKLPPGEDINEWLAIHTIDFYNQINILYATLEEFCTSKTCPIMNAGSRYEYRWADGMTVKKPAVVSAPEYVEYLMNWIENQIDDGTIFPKESGESFPPNFKDIVKQILKRLFRVYAHMYCSHIQSILHLKEEAHLYTCFKHFVLFVSEFQLVDKDELAPLNDLIEIVMKP